MQKAFQIEDEAAYISSNRQRELKKLKLMAHALKVLLFPAGSLARSDSGASYG